MKKQPKTGGFPPRMNRKNVVIKGDMSPYYRTKESVLFMEMHDIRQWKVNDIDELGKRSQPA